MTTRLLVASVTLVLTLGACAASPGGDPSAGSGAQTDTSVSTGATAASDAQHPGPDAVADAVAAALVTADAATDTSPVDAVRRAATWMTPDLAAVLEESETTSGAGWWGELVEHDGSTTAMVEPVEDSGQPADTETTSYRVRWVERIPAGPDGWEGEPYGQTYFITMTRADPAAPWLVSEITAG